MIRVWSDLPGGVDDVCDVAIIGTGAAGAAAGKVLADAGLDVVFLEEGPPIDRKRAQQSLTAAFRHLLRDGGTQVAMGKAVSPVLQGRCVGGSAAINSAICWRLPEEGYDRAFRSYGLADAIPRAELDRWYDVLEKDLEVRQTSPQVMGRNNDLMRLGAEKLGYEGKPTHRNERDCQGSGRCMQTCPNERKRSVEVTYIPHAMKKGARVYATCRATGFLTKGDRVVGVKGRLWDPETGRQHGAVTIHARRGVVLAASVVQTPMLLSTLPLAGKAHVGRHFRAHPGTGVAGIYDEPVRAWIGATQGYEVTHFRRQGFKLESLALGPELGSVRMPGAGSEFAGHLAEFDHYAVWAVAVRADAEGKVGTAPDGLAAISYTVNNEDLAKLRLGMRALADMHFAAGARFVMPGIHGLPTRLRPDQVHLIDDAPIDPRAYSLVCSHLFGTARMAKDAADGVVGFDFQTHGTRGLWVVDSSIFPSNIGVNPMLTIMAVAMSAAEKIARA